MHGRLAFFAAVSASALCAGAANLQSWILTEIYDGAMPVQCYYTNDAAAVATSPGYVVSPAARVDRYKSSSALAYTNFFVPEGYKLDKWYLIKSGREITAANLPATLGEANVCATYSTGSSVTLPKDGIPGWDTFMVLAPSFSWLEYDLLYWENESAESEEKRYDYDAGRTHVYTNEVVLMENKWNRYGYEFLGWSLERDAEEPEFQAGATATGADFHADSDAVDLFAVWRRTIVKVCLHGNFTGSEAFAPLQVGVGDVYKLPEPTRPNHQFAGWYTEAEYGTRIEDGREVDNLSLTNLYAHWTTDVHTITVGSSNRRFGRVTKDGENAVEYEGTLTFKAMPESGSRFDGWSDGVTDAERTVACLSNAVYWARFSIDEDALKVHQAESSVSSVGEEGTTVYFLANGGGGTMAPQTESAGTVFTLNQNAFTNSSEFLGWALSPSAATPDYDDGGLVRDSVSGPLVLYAVWSGGSTPVRKCEIWFDANGGTGVTETVTLREGSAVNLPSCGFRRNGYSFAGWAKDPSAAVSEVDFANGASVDSIASVAGSAEAGWCVLHAVWSEASGGGGGDAALSAAAHAENISIAGDDWRANVEYVYGDEGEEIVTNGVYCTLENAVLSASVQGPGTISFKYSGSLGDVLSFTSPWIADGGALSSQTFRLPVQAEEGSGTGAAWTLFTTNVAVSGEMTFEWSGNEFVKIDEISWSGASSGGGAGEMTVSNAMFVVADCVYDGVACTGIVETIGCEIVSGDIAADAPGEYSTVLRLGEGRCWPGGSVEETTNVTWTVSRASSAGGDSTALYHVYESLSCDGTEKTGVIALAGCEVVENGTGTDAGEYTAVLRLLDGCEWRDGSTSPMKTVSWRIGRGGIDMSGVTLSDAAFVAAKGEEYGLFVEGELPLGVTDVEYSGNGQTEPGLYTVTATFIVDEDNYVPVSSLSATMRLYALFDADSGIEPYEGELAPGSVSSFDVSKKYDSSPLVPDVDAITNAFSRYSSSGTVQFSFAGPDSGDWTATPIGITDAGMTDVWYRVAIDNGGWFEHKIRLTVYALDLSEAELTLDGERFSWTGSAIEPGTHVVYEGQELVSGEDYEVSYSGNVDTGTATATVKGIGNCEGTLAATFSIDPVYCDLSGVALDDGQFVYDGKVKSLVVSGELPEFVSVSYMYDGDEVAGVADPGAYEVVAEFSAGSGYVLSVYRIAATLTIARDASEFDGNLAAVGDYCNWTLPQLGVPLTNTVATTTTVAAKGLPSGLKLVKTKVYGTGKNKKKVVGYNYFVRGVPTSALDPEAMPMYIVVKTGSKSVWHPVRFGVAAQQIADLGQDLGVWTVGAKLDGTNWLAGAGSGWTVSGLPTGLKYTAKAIYKNSKKKSLGKYPAYSVYGTMSKAGLFTITAKKKNSAGFYQTKKYRILVTPKDENAAKFPGLSDRTSVAYEAIEDWVLAEDVASAGGRVTAVSGLPTGLSAKYAYTNAKKKTGKYVSSITGVPTKAGTFAVLFKKGSVSRTILWKVEANSQGPDLAFNDAGGVIASAKAGVRQTSLLAFTAAEGAKVTVSGLPSTVKLVRLADGSYGFAGTATAAGTYLVTVKATLNGKSVSQRLALEFEGLPAWAVGTYNGISGHVSEDVGSIEDFTSFGDIAETNGLAKISVTSAGKISGTCRIDGTNWTLSASAFTACLEDGSYETTNLVAKYSWKVKSGKSYVTKSVQRRLTLQICESDLGGTVRGAVVALGGDGEGFAAAEYLWTANSKYKSIGAKLFYTSKKKQYIERTYKGSTEAGAALGLAANETLKCRITPKGVVTFTLVKGSSSATCSTVVIPLTPAEDGYEAFAGEAPFYFAPNSRFAEHAGALPVE